ncbi:hypothetical protein ACP70R_037448 [Stipagrostis hirtigluma subsp. patula]
MRYGGENVGPHCATAISLVSFSTLGSAVAIDGYSQDDFQLTMPPTFHQCRSPRRQRIPKGSGGGVHSASCTCSAESRAISKYILRKGGGSHLLREGNLSEAAMVDVWLEVESGQFDSAMSPIVFQCFVVPMFMGGTTDMKVVEENLEKLKKSLEVYEARLSRFKY